MYSNKKNVLQLVGLLKASGINRIVLSPGSRNSPVTHSLANDPFFTCHTVVDERSAGFYAIGIIMHTLQPVAVCCTSGTAVLNLGSAVAEAYYQELPLLVITADRPAGWISQMDGQTIPQPGIFNTLVKKSVQLPEVLSNEDEWYCNRLINEAVLELDHHRKGPVHINIPLSEPLFEYTVPDLPPARKIERICERKGSDEDIMEENCFGERFLDHKKRMVIIGQLSYETGRLTKALEELAEEQDCIILAEHLSNIQSPFIIRNFDAFLYTLSNEEKDAFVPDLIITYGGHIVSKRIKQFIRNHPPQEHWHISPSGEITDLYQCLTHCIETDALPFFEYLASCENYRNSKPYASLWGNALAQLPVPADPAFSDMLAVQEWMKMLPADSAIHLANSSSVRIAQLFPLKKGISVYCNRGTSGIDGCVSTAVGYASVSGKLTFLLTGDLAFFYDMNGLWNHKINNKLRILLNNNGGGEIFYALPGLNKSGALENHIAASHHTSAKGWAETMGFTYLAVTHENELKEKMPVFVDYRSDKPVLMEVFTSMEQNAGIMRNYYHELKKK